MELPIRLLWVTQVYQTVNHWFQQNPLSRESGHFHTAKQPLGRVPASSSYSDNKMVKSSFGYGKTHEFCEWRTHSLWNYFSLIALKRRLLLYPTFAYSLSCVFTDNPSRHCFILLATWKERQKCWVMPSGWNRAIHCSFIARQLQPHFLLSIHCFVSS